MCFSLATCLKQVFAAFVWKCHEQIKCLNDLDNFWSEDVNYWNPCGLAPMLERDLFLTFTVRIFRFFAF